VKVEVEVEVSEEVEVEAKVERSLPDRRRKARFGIGDRHRNANTTLER
jgi:hypothetical protein